MNKTLILALAISITTIGCSDDEVVDLSNSDEYVAENSTSEAQPKVIDQSTTLAAESSAQSVVSENSDSLTQQQATMIDDVQQSVDSALNSLSFSDIDTNLDGVLSADEVIGEEQLVNAFEQLDLDHNGDLSEEEYQQFAALIQ